MTYNANIYHFLSRRKEYFLLIVVWTFGLIVGRFLCVPSLITMMCSAFFQPVSIVGSCICIFLPFVLSLYFILCEKTILLLIVCFIKAVAYGFACSLLSCVYGTASWLLRGLFLFSDSCFLPIMMLFWLNYCQEGNRVDRKLVFTGTLFGVLIGATDYCLISPFLERLL